MAHNLAKNEKTGKAAYFGVIEPAWHGLGVTLNEPATAKDAIKHAGLDFDVLQKPCTFNLGDDENPNHIIVPGKHVNYRSDNGKPLGVVGKVYTPLQNREAFGFFDALVDEDEAIYHTAGALGDGEKIWIMAKLPAHIHVGNDDLIDQYVLLSNSHNGSSGVVACFTPIRVVCNNTLTAAIHGTTHKITIPHTTNVATNLKNAHELLGLSNAYANAMEEVFGAMAKKQIKQKDVDAFLDGLYPLNPENEARTAGVKIREGILEAMEVGAGQDLKTTKGTVFGLYNAVTFYTDHMKDYRGDDEFAQNTAKMKSLMFGGGGERKRQSAFDLALAMVN